MKNLPKALKKKSQKSNMYEGATAEPNSNTAVSVMQEAAASGDTAEAMRMAEDTANMIGQEQNAKDAKFKAMLIREMMKSKKGK